MASGQSDIYSGPPVTKLAMDTEAYYTQVQSAYDRIAPRYDTSAGLHAVSRRAKQLALRIVKEQTPPGGRLLDVGCYTGIEALLLARDGYSVVGVDLSPEMIRIANQKAKGWRLTDRIAFETGRASDLRSLLTKGYAPFDTAYSVYGTLNLEPRIDAFKQALSELVRRDGVFVCGLLNPTVLYELLAAPLKLDFHGYRKLRKSAVETGIGVGSDRVISFLYTPREFAARMAPEFRLERVLGLHVLYPPPRGRHSESGGLWWVARALDAIELRLENHFPFSSLGFFSLLVFRRLGS